MNAVLRLIEHPWIYALYCVSGALFVWAAIKWSSSVYRFERRNRNGFRDERTARENFRHMWQAVWMTTCALLLVVAGPAVFRYSVPSFPMKFGQGRGPDWIPFFPWSLPAIWLIINLSILIPLEAARRRRATPPSAPPPAVPARETGAR